MVGTAVKTTGWLAVGMVASWTVVAAWSCVITENVTSSLPLGLYIMSFEPPEKSPFVTFPLPESMRAFFTKRGDIGFFDNGGVFIKRVGAVAGDEVCVIGNTLRVNGVLVGNIRKNFLYAELLPHWSECRRLELDELLTLGDSPDSIDGRFIGPIKKSVATGHRLFLRY